MKIKVTKQVRESLPALVEAYEELREVWHLPPAGSAGEAADRSLLKGARESVLIARAGDVVRAIKGESTDEI